MKRFLVAVLSIVILSVLIFGGCAEPEEPAPAPTPAPAPEKPAPAPEKPAPAPEKPAPAPEKPAPKAGEPVYGGILRQVDDSGPQVLSYLPEMGPWDEGDMLPATEKLLEFDEYHKLVPLLAESYEVDHENLIATFKLRKGIKFTDGSDFNAVVAAWNLQLYKDAHRILFSDKIEEIEIVDDYTIAVHLSDYNNMFDFAIGWVPMFSKEAWDKAGGGDPEKSKEWARVNVVATGPFKLKEYKRDDHMTWVKNEDYWQEGKPYLDGIEVRYVPDSVTARSLLEAGEADMWNAPPVKDQYELEQQGFVRQEAALGTPLILYFDLNANPDSRFQDLRVREAVEYALDRPAIAKALSFGYGIPLLALQSEKGWGFDPNYEGRPYNPEKARELLSEAGYPDGLKVKMLCQTGGGTDLAEAIKRYLDDVGMEVELDIADQGRFMSSAWFDGYEDLLLFSGGSDPDPLMVILVMYGPHPMNLVQGFLRTPELLAMGEEALHQYDLEGKMTYAKKLVRQMADEVALVPLYEISVGYIIQPYVHTTYLKEMSVARRTYNEWMDPH